MNLLLIGFSIELDKMLIKSCSNNPLKLTINNTKKMVYLNSILLHFPSEYSWKYAEDIMKEFKHFDLDDRLQLLGSLGKALIQSKPRRSELKLQYLNYSWDQLSKTSNPILFMRVAIVLTEFAIKNMRAESVNTFISEIFKKFRDYVKVVQDDELYQRLEELIMVIMKTAKDFSEIIGMENFMQLLNFFSSSIKLWLCEIMIDNYLK